MRYATVNMIVESNPHCLLNAHNLRSHNNPNKPWRILWARATTFTCPYQYFAQFLFTIFWLGTHERLNCYSKHSNHTNMPFVQSYPPSNVRIVFIKLMAIDEPHKTILGRFGIGPWRGKGNIVEAPYRRIGFAFSNIHALWSIMLSVWQLQFFTACEWRPHHSIA